MSHTTTGEWKSFEIRMRRRRAERLVVKAKAAAAAGSIEDARTCLAEARRLVPGLDGIAALEARLSRPIVPPARPSRVWPAAAAMLFAVTLGGWFLRPSQFLAARDLRPLHLPAVAGDAHGRSPISSVEFENRDLPLPDVAATTGRTVETADIEARDDSETPVPEPAAALPLRTVETPVVNPAPPPAPIAGVVAGVAAAVDSLPAPAPAPDAAPPPLSTAASIATPRPPAMPPPATPSATPTATATAPRADAAVRVVLDRYADAYSALDAGAAERVWPRVNRGALNRAFDSLASQRIALGDCRIDVSGAAAHATCAGSATWTPKIGGAEPRTEARRWTFELTRAGRDWQIVEARVQNR